MDAGGIDAVIDTLVDEDTTVRASTVEDGDDDEDTAVELQEAVSGTFEQVDLDDPIEEPAVSVIVDPGYYGGARIAAKRA